MAIAKVTMFVEVDDVDDVKDMEHHMDYYIDFDDNPHIKSIFGVEVEEVTEEI